MCWHRRHRFRPWLGRPACSWLIGLSATMKPCAEASATQQKVMKEGQATKQHLDHLDQVGTFFAQGWAARQPSQCPTCGADQPAQGGIQKVVTELKAKVGTAREELLREYRTLDDKIKALQKSLQQRGESPCPLSQER